MSARRGYVSRRTGRRSALTMAEALVSMAIVAGVLAAALHTVGAARMGERTLTEQAQGMLLARQLMSETLEQAYEADYGGGGYPNGSSGRANFTSIDDYNGWQASPPVARDGTELTGWEDWGRTVTVASVLPQTPDQATLGETGVKRITVEVYRDNAKVASLVTLRTKAWPVLDASDDQADDNSPPVAEGRVSANSGQVPLRVYFFASGSIDPDPGDQANLTYHWDFGDGDSAEGNMANHVYDDAGTYTATLTVSDGRGGIGTWTTTIKAYSW